MICNWYSGYSWPKTFYNIIRDYFCNPKALRKYPSWVLMVLLDHKFFTYTHMCATDIFPLIQSYENCGEKKASCCVGCRGLKFIKLGFLWWNMLILKCHQAHLHLYYFSQNCFYCLTFSCYQHLQNWIYYTGSKLITEVCNFQFTYYIPIPFMN